jgi:hypothetical protein
MDDVAPLDMHRRRLSLPHRARGGARGADSDHERAVWPCIIVGVYLVAMMVVTSRPGTAWAQPGADGVFEIPMHPGLPTVVHLPDAVTHARVTGRSIRVTFEKRTLHIRPGAGVSAGLEALLEVETATMLLTFRLRVVARHQDARDELVVVALQSEQHAEQGPLEPGAGDGEPVAEASPEIPVHPKVTTYLIFPDEIVRARFTGMVTGMMRATNLDEKLLIRPSAGLSEGDEVPLRVQTATLRQRFRLRVVRRAADAWRHVVVLAPAAASPEPPVTTARAMLSRAMRMVIDGLLASRDTDASGRESHPAPIKAAGAAATPAPLASLTGHGAAPAKERAGAAARPRFAISIHAVAALAGTTELTVPGYTPTNARQRHRSLGLRVAGLRPGSSWGWEVNVSGEWPAAPTEHRRENVRLDITGPLLRADAGLRVRVGTTLMPTFYAGAGLQAHHRDDETASTLEQIEWSRSMPFRGVLAVGMGLEYRIGDVLLGLELHLRQGVPVEYRSTAVSLSVGIPLDQGE